MYLVSVHTETSVFLSKLIETSLSPMQIVRGIEKVSGGMVGELKLPATIVGIELGKPYEATTTKDGVTVDVEVLIEEVTRKSRLFFVMSVVSGEIEGLDESLHYVRSYALLEGVPPLALLTSTNADKLVEHNKDKFKVPATITHDGQAVLPFGYLYEVDKPLFGLRIEQDGYSESKTDFNLSNLFEWAKVLTTEGIALAIEDGFRGLYGQLPISDIQLNIIQREGISPMVASFYTEKASLEDIPQ